MTSVVRRHHLVCRCGARHPCFRVMGRLLYWCGGVKNVEPCDKVELAVEDVKKPRPGRLGRQFARAARR